MVQPLLDVGGIGGAFQRDAHFFGHRRQQMPPHFHLDRIEGNGIHGFRLSEEDGRNDR